MSVVTNFEQRTARTGRYLSRTDLLGVSETLSCATRAEVDENLISKNTSLGAVTENCNTRIDLGTRESVPVTHHTMYGPRCVRTLSAVG